MTILLIGAGAVASVLSRYLSKDRTITHIRCASRNKKRAEEFIDFSHRKIRFVQLDASHVDQIVSAAKGVDLIINASLPRFNHHAMEAAVRVKSHYQDLASELSDLQTSEQLEFHPLFRKVKRIALINTGVAPGITNALARELADKLDDVESIRIRCLEDQQTNELVFSWSVETTLDDITAPPLIYKNKKFVFTKPFGDAEEFDFPKPIGKRRVYSLYGDEVATIPLFINVQNVDFKSGGSDIEFSKTLIGSGKKIVSKLPSPLEMAQLLKSGTIENAVFALVVEAKGKKDGRQKTMRASIVFPDLREIAKTCSGATYISYPTGLAAYAFSKVFPKMNSCGVFPPEALDREIRAMVFDELKKQGISIRFED